MFGLERHVNTSSQPLVHHQASAVKKVLAKDILLLAFLVMSNAGWPL